MKNIYDLKKQACKILVADIVDFVFLYYVEYVIHVKKFINQETQKFFFFQKLKFKKLTEIAHLN